MHGTNDDSVLQSKVMFNNKQTMLCIRSLGVHAKLLQLCPTLCNPIDRCPPGSSIHGILQARILDWVTMPSSRAYSQPRDQTHVSWSPALAGESFTTRTTREAHQKLLKTKKGKRAKVNEENHELASVWLK